MYLKRSSEVEFLSILAEESPGRVELYKVNVVAALLGDFLNINNLTFIL